MMNITFMGRYVLFGLLTSGILSLSLPVQAGAATMLDDRYTIEKSTIDVGPLPTDTPTPSNSQEEKPYAKGKNYVVRTSRPQALSFTVSQPMLDFGKLTATNPVLRDLSLETSSAIPFQILTFEDHPLQLPSGKVIPDTTCDNGACSDGTAAAWTTTLTYGFGYHLESFDTDTYKQFADTKQNEPIQPLFVAPNADKKHSKVTYKVNISGTQGAGGYRNTVTYLATPDF